MTTKKMYSVCMVIILTVFALGCGKKSVVSYNECSQEQTEFYEVKTEAESKIIETTQQETDTEADEETTMETSAEIVEEELMTEQETTIEQQIIEQTKPRQIVICIDPGHGGESEGTKETYDNVLVMEKYLNYHIAITLKKYLEQNDDIQVILTRDGDYDLSLYDRMKYATDNDADYFISVHVNSRSTDEVNSHGCMVLMSCSRYQPANAKVPDVYDTEMRLAKSIISKLNVLGLPIANDWNTENTGGILQRVTTAGGTYPDGSPADYYSLLYYGTNEGIPSIIVEHAFLSNESDYRNFLCTNEKLEALARADAEAIIETIR